MDTPSSNPNDPRAAPEAQASTRLQDTVDHAAQGVHQAVDRLAERAKPPLQRVENSLDQGSQMLHRRADQVRDMADEWISRSRSTVREHPLAAVGTALLFGLLLGRVTR